MSLAERRANQIDESLAKQTLERQWILEGKAASRAGAPLLWDALADAIREEVEVFSSRVQRAATMSAQLSGNSLSVQTTIFPLVQLHINRLELGVNTRWMIQKYSLGTAKESKWSVYRFAADCNREPCFSDGDAELSPQSLAEKLLEPIFDIF